jgi:hypothetical protein
MNLNHSIVATLKLSAEEKKVASTIGETPASTSEIARKTNLPRSTCLRALKSLHQRGMIARTRMTIHLSGWTQMPDTKKRALHDEFSRFFGIADEHAPIHIHKDIHEVIIYRGKEQMLELADMAKTFKMGERLLWLRGSRAWKEWHTQGFRARIIALMEHLAQTGVICEEILSDQFVEFDRRYGGAAMVASYAKRLMVLTVIPDAYLNGFYSDIMVFRDAVSIMNWHDEIAILIKNRDLVAFYTQLFTYLRDTGTSVDPRKITSQRI